VCGWPQVAAQVYHRGIDAALFARLDALASAIRG